MYPDFSNIQNIALQWGHVQNDVEIRAYRACQGGFRCFNGATYKMTWKFGHRTAVKDEIGRLQWGHVQNDVEISKVLKVRFVARVASMGPRTK